MNLKNSLLVVLVFAFQLVLFGQNRDLLSRMSGSGKPVFDLEIVKLFSQNPDTLKLGNFISISNNNLHFKKIDDLTYKADYSIHIAVFDPDEDFPLVQNSEMFSINCTNYEDTEKQEITNNHDFYFNLPEGSYKVVVKIQDKVTNTFFTQEKNISYNRDGALFGVTRPILVSADEEKFSASKINPQPGNIINSDFESVGIFFQVLCTNYPVSYEIDYKIINDQKFELASETLYRRAHKQVENELIRFKVKDVSIGRYQVEIKLKIAEKEFIRRVDFFVRWKNYNLNISDVSKAIRQMIYIEDPDTLENVLKKPVDDQKKWFSEFWKISGEDITTGKNALLDEYFRRISYAQMRYSTPKKEGWRSDMGQIYCIMGTPDEVRSYALPKGLKPYEVWVYYSKGVQYIFDYIGGEYKLRR